MAAANRSTAEASHRAKILASSEFQRSTAKIAFFFSRRRPTFFSMALRDYAA
jgi:hypothetical protein